LLLCMQRLCCVSYVLLFLLVPEAIDVPMAMAQMFRS